MHTISNSKSNKTVIVSFFILLLVFIFNSCKKENTFNNDNPESISFFKLPENSPSILHRVISNLKQQESKRHFIDNFIKSQGFPLWKNAKIVINPPTDNSLTSSTDTLILVPIVENSRQIVKSILAIKVNNDIWYKLLEGMKYRDLPLTENISTGNVFTAMDLIKMMMEFELDIYGHNEFLITDIAISSFYIPTDEPIYTTQVSTSNGCTIFNWGYYSSLSNEFIVVNSESMCLYETGELVYTLELPEIGGGGGGPFYIPPYIPLPTSEPEMLDYIIRQLNLDQTQQFYLTNSPEAISVFFTYLYENNTINARNIVLWGINYLIQNPNIDIRTFQNQFLGKSEGYEGNYDSFWDNPNLNFPQQSLPNWDDFKNAFPLDSDPNYDSPEKMYNSIGGVVATLYSGPKTNTCAIRLSKALNYSGVSIPYIPGQTYKGADNKYYFKAAYQINIWMKKTFGTNPATHATHLNTNHYSYTQAEAGINGINLPRLLGGKKGIYSIFSSNFNWASGHADILNPDTTCGNNCHFADAPIHSLDVWDLN